jgi:ABC-type transport system involved in cytochrome c biogenesis permease subunit
MKTRLARLAPWIACALALAGALIAALPSGRQRGFDVEGFGRLPALEGGRVKPIDSVARNALLVIRSQQSFRHEGRTIGADEWLLDVMFRPDVADQQKAFVINDPEVLGLMRLEQTSDRYFSFATIAPHLEEIERQASIAQGIEAQQRTRFQSAIANLYERLFLYYKLRNTVQLAGTAGLGAELGIATLPGAGRRHAALAELAQFRPIPPAPGTSGDQGWQSVGEALGQVARGATPAGLAPWARLSVAWTAQDPASFARAVSDASAAAGAVRPDAVAQAGHEVVFNRAAPFYAGIVIYVLALLAVFVSWLKWPEVLQPAAFGLLVAGALVHTAGLVSRVILQGRPPVTNLYSSAVFVGWAVVILGVILERLYRRGFATSVAAACGVSTLIVAHHLSGDGDTMEMMRAVLDSNFWLGTHVITITIGYSGMFLAGAIAIGWTIWKHVARAPDPSTSKALAGMTYGVICFALFFSFVGTVLGGIWADQSWGRFWGWDPKENGALLIVLWSALILHARWGGYARERGMMAMAIFGNVITSLSWFGVNMLGVGLHSYGFMDKAFWALFGFIASQLAIMGFTLLPRAFWKVRPAGEAKPAGRDAQPEPGR